MYMSDRADSFGSFVRARRRKLDLRQEELAALAGVSTRFVHTVEHDKQTVRLDSLLTLLDTLGVKLVATGPEGSVDVNFFAGSEVLSP